MRTALGRCRGAVPPEAQAMCWTCLAIFGQLTYTAQGDIAKLSYPYYQRYLYQWNQQRLKLLKDIQANAQLQSGVYARQARASVATASAGVDVSKLAPARQALLHVSFAY